MSVDENYMEFTQDIIENSNGSELRIGDFIIRHDYGTTVYYDGPGGNVEIPEEVGKESLIFTFENSKNITSLHYPGTVESISNPHFGSYDVIETLIFDEGLKRIWNNGFFADCKKLKDVFLPESLEYLGPGAFKNTPWYRKQIEVVDGCHYLGRFLIGSEKDIQSAIVRDGTVMICSYAFQGRKNLTRVVIPDSVKTLADMAFGGCSALEEIHMPASIKTIEDSCFTGCVSLKYVEALNPDLDLSCNAFGSSKSKVLYYPTYVYLPIEIKGRGAELLFLSHGYLTSRERFAATLQEVNDAVIKRNKSKLLDLVMETENSAVLRNLAPLAVTKDNIDLLIDKAQNNGLAETVAFLLDWKSKNYSSFDLEKQQRKELSRDPMSATELKKVWNTKKMPDGTLGISSYKGTDHEISIPECIGKAKVTAICREAFSASTYSPIGKRKSEEQLAVRKAIRTVKIPDGVKSIEYAAFEYCENLESVYLPASVTEINRSFLGCQRLTIHAPAGSYAEQYAKENKISFEAI